MGALNFFCEPFFEREGSTLNKKKRNKAKIIM